MKKLVLSLCSGVALFAHDLYLMPQKFMAAPGEKILLSAHTGDSFPKSEHGIDPARLTSYPAMADGAWRILGNATHATVEAPSRSGYFGIASKPLFLSMEPAKFEEYLKEEGLTAALELRRAKGETGAKSREMYSKYAKTFVAVGGPSEFARPLGLKIEFVPQVDLAKLKAGDSLPLMVLYNGKPLADAQVEMAVSRDAKTKSEHTIAGRTDSAGRITVKAPEAGKVRVHCVQMERVKAETHEWESYWASLTFEVTGAGRASSDTVSSR